MSNKTDIVLVVSTEELPYFLKNYDDRKAELPNAGLAFGAHPNGWVMRLTNVTTREVLEFFAYVYADMPEEAVHEEAPISEEEGAPVPTKEEFVKGLAEYSKSLDEEDDVFEEDTDEDNAPEEEDEEDESLSDLSDTEEGREVKAKLKKVVKVRKAVPSERKLAEAATVVSTGNKAVTIEGS